MLLGQLMRNRPRSTGRCARRPSGCERERRARGRRGGARGAHADRRRAARRRRARDLRDDRPGGRRAPARRARPRPGARRRSPPSRATGREALTELRRLLGVLRREDEELALAPQPSLAHVDALVRAHARRRAAGRRCTIEGEARALPAGVDLTAYRLVQEALGGARDAGHAGRARRARSATAPDGVDVEVADDGAGDGPRGCSACASGSRVYGGELTRGRPPRRRLARSPRGCPWRRRRDRRLRKVDAARYWRPRARRGAVRPRRRVEAAGERRLRSRRRRARRARRHPLRCCCAARGRSPLRCCGSRRSRSLRHRDRRS